MIIETEKNHYILKAKKCFYFLHPKLYSQIRNDKQENGYYQKKLKMLQDNKHFDSNKFELEGMFSKEGLIRAISNTYCIDFEVTERCNLNCYYCAYGKFYNNIDKRNDQDININRAIAFFDYIVKYINSPQSTLVNNPIHIGYYGGEPLLNFKAVKELTEYAKGTELKNDNFFKFFMTTNGVLLNKYMDYLVENDFMLTISLDGNREHNSFRTFHNEKESFDIVFRNIKKLMSHYPEYFKSRVLFNGVLHGKNNIEDVTKFFRKEFSIMPRLSIVSETGFNNDYMNIYDSEFNKRDTQVPIEGKCYQVLKNYGNIIKENYYELFFNPDYNTFLPTGTCYPFSRRCYMTANGKILPCEKVGHEYVFGKVDENGVHLDLEEVAKRLNLNFTNVKNQCNECINAFNCTECMFCMPFKDNLYTCDKVNSDQIDITDFGKAIERIENDEKFLNYITQEYGEL